MTSKCPTVVAQADLHSAIAVPVGLMGRTVFLITSTFPAAGQEGSLQHTPSLGLLLPSPAPVQVHSAACPSSGAGLCPSSAPLLAPLLPLIPSDMGARHCYFIRSSFKCFNPLLRSQQLARCSTRHGNLKLKIVAKSGYNTFL